MSVVHPVIKMLATNSARIEALTKDNFDTWSLHMEAILIKNDAWVYASGESPKPESVQGNAESEQAFKAWVKADMKARSDIFLAISPTELKQVKGCTTSREVWLKLLSIYQSKGPARKATLLKQLTVQKLEAGGDVRDHLNRFFDAVDKLHDMGVEINSDLLSIMLLYSLPATFENFRCAIESRDELPHPDVLRVKILEESDARRHNQGSSSGGNALFFSKNHEKQRRRFEKPKQETDKTPLIRCFRCKTKGHKASECPTKSNQQRAGFADDFSFTVSNSAKTPGTKWILDSGATSHVVGDREIFEHLDNSKRGKLNLANDTTANIAGTGTARFAADVHGKTVGISLKQTLHVPEARTNLLSISKIADNGFRVLFDKEKAVVLRENGEDAILVADRIGDLYYIREQSSNLQRETSNVALVSSRNTAGDALLWHRRMGHLNAGDLKRAIREETVQGIPFQQCGEEFACDVCCRGKMIRTPFPKRSGRSTTPLELVHTDVCGPMSTESIGKSKYFVEFVDDHSRWCEVRFIRHKSDVLQVTKDIVAMFERQKKTKLKCLQSDNGTEYTSADFDNYLRTHGIKRRLTIPYNPEQNGIAERKNRTLLETARCLLLEADLPPMFWAEAVSTANYIRNRCPSKSVNGKTPYEMWTGEKPDVSHFHVFGENVMFLDRRPGKGKFDARSKAGIFLGYAEESKGYRIWFPDEKRVISSRDVKFVSSHARKEGTYEEFFSERQKSETQRGVPRSVEIDITSPVVDDEIRNDRREDADVNVTVPEEGSENLDGAGSSTRGRGRPKIIRTGSRGRPKKEYHVAAEESGNVAENDTVLMAEVPMKQAVTGPDSEQWNMAMAKEIVSIIKNKTWEVVSRPENCQIIGSRMVLRNKFNPDGTIQRRKARLVAQGFSQKPGIHFNETFAPVARLGSIRLLVSLAARLGMKMQQYDVACAYLNGELEEVIHMEPPKQLQQILALIVETEENEDIAKEADQMLKELQRGNKVCLLRKALYGLRQAGKNWHRKLDATLKAIGAKPTSADACLYYVDDGGDPTLIAIYVDDIIVASKRQSCIDKVGAYLKKEFETKDLGTVKNCLGLEFSRREGQITIRQKAYIRDVLVRFGMEECKPVSTPMDSAKLSKARGEPTPEDLKLPYRELVGALTYLSTGTRPDISFAVSYLAQFNNCFRKEHWTAAKRVLRYLKGTADIGLTYKQDSGPVRGFVDADWGNDPDDRKSFTGYVFVYNGAPISWDAKKQRTVALSSTEAEYMGVTEAAKEAIYLRALLNDLGIADAGDITVYNDNLSALKLAENSTFHGRSKHIDVRYHFIRDALKGRLLKMEHLPTEEMPADMLTKGLSRAKHVSCIQMLGLESNE